jgi:hypothetical protein
LFLESGFAFEKSRAIFWSSSFLWPTFLFIKAQRIFILNISKSHSEVPFVWVFFHPFWRYSMNSIRLEISVLLQKNFLNHLVDDFLLSVFSVLFFGNIYCSDVGSLELILNFFY